MAFAHLTAGGTNFSSSATTSIAATNAAGDIPAGSFALAVCGKDNTSTSADGDNSEVTSVVDSVGNTWTKVAEETNVQGGAATGATVSLWMCLVTTLIRGTVPVSSVTFNFASCVAKAEIVGAFSIGAGNSVRTAGTIQRAATDGAALPAQTISGLTSKEYLFVRVSATEGVVSSPTAGTNYSALTGTTVCVGTSGGSSTSNMCVLAAYRIFAGTGDSNNATNGSSDSASLYVAFEEFSSGTIYNDTLSESAAAADALANAQTSANADAESAAAADSLNPAGSTFAVPLSESAAAAVSLSSTQTFVNTQAESAAASDSLTGGLLLTGSLNEAAAAADALTTAVTWGPTDNESAAANDSVASSATFGSALSETAATSDSLAAGNVMAASAAESAAAADSETAAQTFVSSVTETAASADALSAGLVIAKSLNETAAAADSATVAVTFNPALAESAAAAETEASSQAMANALGETSATGDTEASKETFNVSLSETSGANDSVSAGATVYNEAVNENLTALQSLGVGLVLPTSVDEAATAGDDQAARADLGAALDEQAGANDNVAGLVSSIFPPGPVDPARIGTVDRLNGISAIAAQSRSEAVAAIRKNGRVAAAARVGKVNRVGRIG